MVRRDMTRCITAIVTVALLICASTPRALTKSQVPVPGTKVSLVPPPDFKLSSDFAGFVQMDTGASIMVLEFPAPFNSAKSQMSEEGIAAQGMGFVSMNELTIAGAEALLIEATQDNDGDVYRKWMAVFGNAKATVMLVTSCPDEFSSTVGPLLETAIRSTQWHTEAEIGHFEGLSFRIEGSENLQVAKRTGNVLLVTPGGQTKRTSPDEPMVMVTSTFSGIEVEDLEEFSKTIIQNFPDVTDISDIEGSPGKVGPLPGYELTAKATEAGTGQPFVLYQAVGLKDGTCYVFQGSVGSVIAEGFLSEFRQVVNSLTLAE